MSEADRPLTRREMREVLAAQQAASAPVDAPAEIAEPAPTEIPEPAPAEIAEPAPVVVPESTDAHEDAPSQTEDESTDKPERAKREKSVWSYLGTGITIGLLLIVLAVAALAIVVPAVTGSKALTVATGSMKPALPPGTMIVVKPVDVKDIKPGDVLTYQLKSGEPTLITHRVTQQLQTADGEYQFITQGDNNPKADPDPVRAVQVVGIVWYSIPLIGWVSQWVTGDMRQVIIPIVVGVLFVYATFMIISGLRDRAKKKRA